MQASNDSRLGTELAGYRLGRGSPRPHVVDDHQVTLDNPWVQAP